ncbi:MAG: hypothetical protein PCFJNLEI_00816 [Verrucomicrobiae bacterium]|nr:hypothetical protein [Verrucomicrobiae bacterium]
MVAPPVSLGLAFLLILLKMPLIMAANSNQDLQFLDQFEPDLFWQKYGRKILWGVAAVAVIGIIAILQQRQSASRAAEASLRLAQANDPLTLQGIARDYSGKTIGAQALLRLGELHYAAGRLAESGAAFQELISRYPSNPLAEPARLSAVAVVESQGNFEAAKSQYLELASRPGTYLAVAAKLGAARCAEALGQTKEAQQLYDELVPATQGTAWDSIVFVRRSVVSRSVAPPPMTPVVPPPSLPEVK